MGKIDPSWLGPLFPDKTSSEVMKTIASKHFKGGVECTYSSSDSMNWIQYTEIAK